MSAGQQTYSSTGVPQTYQTTAGAPYYRTSGEAVSADTPITSTFETDTLAYAPAQGEGMAFISRLSLASGLLAGGMMRDRVHISAGSHLRRQLRQHQYQWEVTASTIPRGLRRHMQHSVCFVACPMRI